MSNLTFSIEPARQYCLLCSQNASLFHSPEWLKVLNRGFKAQSFYGWDDQNEIGLAVSIFRKSLFRIGFVGFPVGGTISSANWNDTLISKMRSASYPISPHVFRLSVSPFSGEISLPKDTERVWETAIVDLQNWHLEDLTNSIRRNIYKAKGHNLKISEAKTPAEANIIYKIYTSTVQRHGGMTRYTRSYFQALVELAQANPRIRCFIASDQSEVAAFLVAGLNQKAAYYLHGGLNMSLQSKRPSDLLFGHAIQWAKDNGMTLFNFMASPTNQLGLVRYKEKWGGETRHQHTFNIPISPIGGRLFVLSMKLFRLWKKVLERGGD